MSTLALSCLRVVAAQIMLQVKELGFVELVAQVSRKTDIPDARIRFNRNCPLKIGIDSEEDGECRPQR